MFAELEKQQQSLNVDSFGVSITTMEDVFLKLNCKSLLFSTISPLRVGELAEQKMMEANGAVTIPSEQRIDPKCKSFPYKSCEKLFPAFVGNERATGFSRNCLQLYAMLAKRVYYL